MRVNRIFLLVLDGVGVGELPDAQIYGDKGSNTLQHIAETVQGLNLPNLERGGLGNLTSILGVPAQSSTGVYGKLNELSVGKDTTTGHWEMTGIILDKPFPVYPQGFPDALIHEFSNRTGCKVIGNKAASGTIIIEELGVEHIRSGALIVYTSADSVFQIAAHEAVVSREQLYRYCEIARSLLQGEHGIGRVIARPFCGEPGSFYRTDGRKDFSLDPIQPTILDRLKEKDYTVFGVGKIEDIFNMRGLTHSNHTHNNQETLTFVSELIEQDFKGLVFANCIDFDMLYGHRNDPVGYAKALEMMDEWLGRNIPKLHAGDVLIITGDHGGDPTTPSTDHSREYTPLLLFGPNLPDGVGLGIRNSFADIAATIAYWFEIDNWSVGTEFASLIEKG